MNRKSFLMQTGDILLSSSGVLAKLVMLTCAVVFFVPGWARSQEVDAVELFSLSILQLLEDERCIDVIGNAAHAANNPAVGREMSEEQIVQYISLTVLTLFLASYAEGADMSFREATQEIRDLCEMNPNTPILQLTK